VAGSVKVRRIEVNSATQDSDHQPVLVELEGA
jgi:endonuclease/exonuclease/phosphatase family metal-dependent hydrolase